SSTYFYTLSLHDALPIYLRCVGPFAPWGSRGALAKRTHFERLTNNQQTLPRGVGSVVGVVASLCPLPHLRCHIETRLTSVRAARSEEHTSELQSRENLVC